MALETFHFRLGDFRCIAFSDKSSIVTEQDIATMYPIDTERMLTNFRALSTPFAFGYNLLLVETGHERLLIDSGGGLLDDPSDPGQLVTLLGKENISLESIDTIVISHCHLDHTGGLLDSE